MKKRAFVRYSKQGKVVPGSLILTGGSFPKGPSTWKEVPADLCCEVPCGPVIPPANTKSFNFDIEKLYDNLGRRLESCHTYIRSKIKGVNLFYDDDNTPNMIDDGGSDMYDGGNALNTNLTQLYVDIKEDNINTTLNIPYTHTQATSYNDDYLYANPPMDGGISNGSSYFGLGSKYFTNMYPGLFVMAAQNISISEFSITGNLGTDGEGVDYFFGIPTSYTGWRAYCKANKDTYSWGDPTVNHLILVNGNPTGITQVGDTVGEYDDHALQGMTGITNMIVVVFSTLPGTDPVTEAQVRELADAVLDVASGTSICNN